MRETGPLVLPSRTIRHPGPPPTVSIPNNNHERESHTVVTDLLIAGGGLVGSAAAIHLGRLGISAELFERGRFPKEKPCGEGLMPAGVAALERLGLNGEKGAPFNGVRYHVGGRNAGGRFPKTLATPSFARGLARRR